MGEEIQHVHTKWSLLCYFHALALVYICGFSSLEGRHIFDVKYRPITKEYVLLEGKRGGGDTSSMSN